MTPSQRAASDAEPSDAGLPASCETDRVLQIALRLHVYAQVLGGSPAAMKGEVDQLLHDAYDAEATDLWRTAVVDDGSPVLK